MNKHSSKIFAVMLVGLFLITSSTVFAQDAANGAAPALKKSHPKAKHSTGHGKKHPHRPSKEATAQ